MPINKENLITNQGVEITINPSGGKSIGQIDMPSDPNIAPSGLKIKFSEFLTLATAAEILPRIPHLPLKEAARRLSSDVAEVNDNQVNSVIQHAKIRNEEDNQLVLLEKLRQYGLLSDQFINQIDINDPNIPFQDNIGRRNGRQRVSIQTDAGYEANLWRVHARYGSTIRIECEKLEVDISELQVFKVIEELLEENPPSFLDFAEIARRRFMSINLAQRHIRLILQRNQQFKTIEEIISYAQSIGLFNLDLLTFVEAKIGRME